MKLNDMLENGEVLAEDLLPKLADVLEKRFGDAAEDAGKRAAASFENLRTSITELQRSLVSEGILQDFASLADSTRMWVDANKDLIAQDLTLVFKTVAGAGGIALAVLDKVGKLMGGISTAVEAVAQAAEVAAEKIEGPVNAVEETKNRLRALQNELTALYAGFYTLDDERQKRRQEEINGVKRSLEIYEQVLQNFLDQEESQKRLKEAIEDTYDIDAGRVAAPETDDLQIKRLQGIITAGIDAATKFEEEFSKSISKTTDEVANELQKQLDIYRSTGVAELDVIAKVEKEITTLRKKAADERRKIEEAAFKAWQKEQLKRYAYEIELAKQLPDDLWLIRKKGLEEATKRAERYQEQETIAAYKAEIKKQEEIAKAQEKARKEQLKEYEDFLEDIEDETADVFKDIFDGTVNDFSDLTDRMKDLFTNMLAEMAAKAIAEPIIMPIVQSVGGVFGISAPGTGGTTGASGLSGLNIPGVSGFLSTPIPGGIPTTPFGTGAGVTPAGQVATPLTYGNLLGYAGAGSFGYGLAADLLGLPQSQVSGLTSGGGAALGGYLATGTAVGGPLGAAIGAIAGGLLGSVFGDEPTPPNTGIGVGGSPQANLNQGRIIESALFDFVADIGGVGTQQAKDELTSLVLDYFNTSFDTINDNLGLDINRALQKTQLNIDVKARDRSAEAIQEAFDLLTEQSFEKLRAPLLEQLVGPGLEGAFSEDFFKNIQQGSESLFDTFTRFGTVVQETDNFLEEFTRRTETFGLSAVKAFEEVQVVNNIINTIETSVSEFANVQIVNTLGVLADSWAQLLDTLEDSNATVEQLAEAERARNEAIGTNITGLTATSLQQALFSGKNLEEALQSVSTTLRTSAFAETLIQDFISPVNEEIGRIYTESGGDLLTVANAISNIDLSDISDDFLRIQAELEILSRTEEDRLKLLEEERDILESLAEEAKDNYIDALDRELDAQKQIAKDAEKLADDLEKVAESISTTREGILKGTGDPRTSFAIASEQYSRSLQQALLGDPTALEDVPKLAEQLIDSAQGFIADPKQFNTLVNTTVQQLSEAKKVANTEEMNQRNILDAAQVQVSLLEEQLNEVKGVNPALLSIEESLNAYNNALMDLRAKEEEVSTAQVQVQVQSDPVSGFIAGAYRDILGREPDPKGLAYWESQLTGTSDPVTVENFREAFSNAAQAELQGFSDGGISSGPASGYPVMLHGTEAVIPLNGESVPVIIQGESSGVSEEKMIQILTSVLNALGINNKNTIEIRDILDRVTQGNEYIQTKEQA